jgi:hypothetical protein
MRRYLTTLAMLILVLLFTQPAGGDDHDFVAGQGSTHLSVLNVSAQQSPQGDTGYINLHFRGQVRHVGDRFRVEVDCVTVTNDEMGAVEGEIAKSSIPDAVGERLELEVFDGGKASPGHQPGPDIVHINWSEPPQGWQGNQPPNCLFDSGPFSNVRDGNIEVHDAS